MRKRAEPGGSGRRRGLGQRAYRPEGSERRWAEELQVDLRIRLCFVVSQYGQY